VREKTLHAAGNMFVGLTPPYRPLPREAPRGVRGFPGRCSGSCSLGAITVAGQRRSLTGLPHFKPGLRAPGTRDLEAKLWPPTGLTAGYHEEDAAPRWEPRLFDGLYFFWARLGLTQIAQTERVQSSAGPPTIRPACAIQPVFETG